MVVIRGSKMWMRNFLMDGSKMDIGSVDLAERRKKDRENRGSTGK